MTIGDTLARVLQARQIECHAEFHIIAADSIHARPGFSKQFVNIPCWSLKRIYIFKMLSIRFNIGYGVALLNLSSSTGARCKNIAQRLIVTRADRELSGLRSSVGPSPTILASLSRLSPLSA